MEAAGECVHLAVRPSLEQRQGCVLSPGEDAQPHKAACAVHLLERKCLGSSLQPRWFHFRCLMFQSFHKMHLNHSLIWALWVGWLCCLYCKPNIRLEYSSLNSFWRVSFPFKPEMKSCRRVWQGHNQVLRKVSGQLFSSYTQCFAVVIGGITPWLQWKDSWDESSPLN